MPRTIYESKSAGHAPQAPYVPIHYAYIGDFVQQRPVASWRKITVWNRVGTSWWILNAGPLTVDYNIRDLKYNRFVIDIIDEKNPDYREYTLTVTPKPSSWETSTIDLPDDADNIPVEWLEPNTEYTINLIARLSDGSWSPDSIRTVTTPDNPIPLAPINLSSPSRSNTWIDLSWSSPSGSSAVTYNLYRGTDKVAPTVARSGLTREQAKKYRLTGLRENIKYQYWVTGVNAEGLEGPRSNVLRWATGQDAKYRKGSMSREPMKVHEFGSWRNDIGWNDWHYWPNRVPQDSIFQGFWVNDNRRYRGCVTYRQHEFRVAMNSKFGQESWRHLSVSRAEIERLYRMRAPGNYQAQYLLWHLTNVNVFDSSGPPPVYGSHRNDRNDADAVAAHDRITAGGYINSLRIPRAYAKFLVAGQWGSTPVNGIMLYRGDGENNGYGTAGYMECAGHLQRDRHINEAWRYSDFTLRISGSWDFKYVNYQAPYQW